MKPHSMQKRAEKHLLIAGDYMSGGSRYNPSEKRVFKASRVPQGGLASALFQKGRPEALADSMHMNPSMTATIQKGKRNRPASSAVYRPRKSNKLSTEKQVRVNKAN